MNDDTLMVFTADSIEHILNKGGTSAWHLKASRARDCEYAVCTRKNAGHKRFQEPHLSAFIIGMISGVVPFNRPDFPTGERYLVRFSKYALISIPEAWKKQQNPIKYLALTSLGIDPSKLKWETMPEILRGNGGGDDQKSPIINTLGGEPTTIAQTKANLARALGVRPEQIEITIKG